MDASPETAIRPSAPSRVGLSLFKILGVVLFLGCPSLALGATCLYVSSYHVGYEWNDRIEQGMNQVLEGECTIERFYMDTKRNKSAAYAKSKALQAIELIRTRKPDIIIACDDNASKYLVSEYLRNNDTPVIFCGINWTVEPYGYPYKNTTGIIERAPIEPLLAKTALVVPATKTLTFIAADVATQRKEVTFVKKFALRRGIEVKPVLVKDFEEWKKAVIDAQSSDVVLISNIAGIEGWKPEEAQ